jgi:hypothetical protein
MSRAPAVTRNDASSRDNDGDVLRSLVDADANFIRTFDHVSRAAVNNTLAHLSAIKRISESMTNSDEQFAIVCEPTASFDLVALRRKRPLAHYIDMLPDDWEIVQLGCATEREELNFLNERGFVTDLWRASRNDTFAYSIHRRGVAQLMQRHWNETTQRWRLRARDEQTCVTSACVLFDGLDSYTSTIPWFRVVAPETNSPQG